MGTDSRVIDVTGVGAVGDQTADGLVVGCRADNEFDSAAEWVLSAVPWARDRLDDADFKGGSGQLVVVPTDGPYRQVAFVGLGDDPDHDDIRAAAGAAVRSLRTSETIATSLHHAGGVRPLVEGLVLGGYTFDEHKSDPKPSRLASIALLEGTSDDEATAREALTICDAVSLARDLVNQPAMYKSPAVLAERAETIAAATGMSVTVWTEEEIARERLGGLQGVALGADNPARLVVLRHEPEGATATLALVGKGIVFDSGGLSIKPASGMEDMKTDMSGAAAVIAAMQAIATLEIPVRVVAFTPLTENMPGGGAVRPGDVLHTRNGKTIEVLNTDAEGRVVLADGLALAVEEDPDLIVDLATLTGACVVSLGRRIAGLFGTDDAVSAVAAAADSAGERVWHLPLPDDYRPLIDSDIADMRNTAGGERYGGAITAALLLKEFAGDGSWAHLDIAGPARAVDSHGHIVKGGTGFGVTTLVELARAMVDE